MRRSNGIQFRWPGQSHCGRCRPAANALRESTRDSRLLRVLWPQRSPRDRLQPPAHHRWSHQEVIRVSSSSHQPFFTIASAPFPRADRTIFPSARRASVNMGGIPLQHGRSSFSMWAIFTANMGDLRCAYRWRTPEPCPLLPETPRGNTRHSPLFYHNRPPMRTF